MDYPKVVIKDGGKVRVDTDKTGYLITRSVEALVLAKILEKLESIDVTLKELNGKAR